MTAPGPPTLVAVFLAVAPPATVAAQPRYRVADLGPLPGTVEARATAVNADGTAVGSTKPAGGFNQAALWPSGTGAPTSVARVIGSSASVANGINDVGHFTTVAGITVADQSTGGRAHFRNGTTLFDIGKLGSGAPSAPPRAAACRTSHSTGRAPASPPSRSATHWPPPACRKSSRGRPASTTTAWSLRSGPSAARAAA